VYVNGKIRYLSGARIVPLSTRIIVSLLHDGQGNCLKPVSFGRPARPIGSLMQAVKVCARREIDQLCLVDILSTERGLYPGFRYLKEISKHIACPLLVGGGVHKMDDARQAFDNGADAVLLNSNCNLKELERMANTFGSQSISVNLHDRHPVLQLDPIQDWRDYTLAGAGELVVTDADADGTMKGYNLQDINMVASRAACPVVANGGCGDPQHMHEAICAGASAVMAGAMFLFTQTTPKDAAKFLQAKGHTMRVVT
jgi:cyclase